jgi:predicted ferric reductase
MSTIITREYFYEVFAKSHLILTYLTIGAIWFHLPPSKTLEPPRLYLVVAACLQAVMSFFHFIRVLYRNFKPLNEACIEPHIGAITIRITISRPWKYRAGQYIFLCLPGVSLTSWFQLHPFMICSWDQNHIFLLIQERRGFTAHLRRNQYEVKKAIIQGPYGNGLDVESYGTVLLFATGIGIAAQLPYIRQLLEGYQNAEVKTRKITLFWEIDAESK